MTQTNPLEKDVSAEQIELREAVNYARSIGTTGVNGVSVEVLEHYFALLDQTTSQVAT
ncbi:hypothetical protein D3C84_832880 [compost metagenome]